MEMEKLTAKEIIKDALEFLYEQEDTFCPKCSEKEVRTTLREFAEKMRQQQYEEVEEHKYCRGQKVFFMANNDLHYGRIAKLAWHGVNGACEYVIYVDGNEYLIKEEYVMPTEMSVRVALNQKLKQLVAKESLYD